MNPTKLSPHQQALLHLCYVVGFGSQKLNKLLKIFGSPEKILAEANQSSLKTVNLPENLKKDLAQIREKVNIEDEILLMEKESIEVFFLGDQDYPANLKEISSPPLILFAKGNSKLLTQNQIAIVGTRRPSDYGKLACQKLTNELCDYGFVITSGMAQGIDSTAHLVALERSGKTIAVLGEGILKKRSQYAFRKLFDQIISNQGLIVSEYPPFFPAQKYTFPARNRIISGLSLGTLVIEASERSGSLITANFALEQGREVFAIPGSIFSSMSSGCHLLIKQGAKLIQSGNDILQEFEFHKTAKEEVGQGELMLDFTDALEKTIYLSLSLDPVSIDQLTKIVQLTPSEISAKLSLLEIKGFVQNIGGGRFVKKQL